MFICEDCGSVFDDVEISEEVVGYYGSAPQYEYWNVCPFCKSTEIHSYIESYEDEME